MSTPRQKAEKKGRRAETAAILFLRGKGYSILAQRYRSKRGEIDIIARKADTVAFIEVKARKDIDSALYSLGNFQRRRIEAAAEDWLRTQKKAAASLRFDIIAVAPWAIPTHITDAWRTGE